MLTVHKLIYISLSFLLFSSCNKVSQELSSVNIGSITNGETKAKLGEFSWLVKVDTCAGVIIDKRFILTVAHCVHDKRASLITLRAGNNGAINELQYLSKAKRVIVHPDYKSFKESHIKENDIALIELKEDIVFTQSLNKAKLPTVNQIENADQLRLGGYGRAEDKSYPKELRFLRSLELLESSDSDYWDNSSNLNMLVPDDDHQDFIGTYFTGQYLAVKVKGQMSACRGDSGAPLVSVSSSTVIGLVSHGSEDCVGQKAFFLTKVSRYTDWIKQEVANESE
mgnify:CR=1 FL=1